MDDNTLEVRIGGDLMKLRESRGLSRQAAADLMGSTASSLWRIETDDREPRLAMLARIALALGGRIVIDPNGVRVERTRLVKRPKEEASAA